LELTTRHRDATAQQDHALFPTDNGLRKFHGVDRIECDLSARQISEVCDEIL
jgi:hypothetical protein